VRLPRARPDDFVGIGKAGLLSGECPHSDSLLDARAAVFDDAVLKRPRFLARDLKIKIGEIHAMPQHFAEDLIQARIIETARTQDELAGNAERSAAAVNRSWGSCRGSGHVLD